MKKGKSKEGTNLPPKWNVQKDTVEWGGTGDPPIPGRSCLILERRTTVKKAGNAKKGNANNRTGWVCQRKRMEVNRDVSRFLRNDGVGRNFKKKGGGPRRNKKKKTHNKGEHKTKKKKQTIPPPSQVSMTKAGLGRIGTSKPNLVGPGGGGKGKRLNGKKKRAGGSACVLAGSVRNVGQAILKRVRKKSTAQGSGKKENTHKKKKNRKRKREDYGTAGCERAHPTYQQRNNDLKRT